MDMKRVGSFNVTDHIVYECPEALDAVAKLMGEVFICSAIHNFGYGRFEYIGFSGMFSVVEQGMSAPAYIMEVTQCGEEGEEYYVAHFSKAAV